MFLLGILLGCVEPETEYVTETETVTIEEGLCASILGHQPCDFATFDENGSEVYFSDLMGKPVILDLSTMWCGPCNVAAEDVQAVQNAYPGVTYLTILIENFEGEAPIYTDLQDWEILHNITTAPTWGGSRDLVTADPIETAGEFFLGGWPTFYFLDEELRVVGYQRGFDQSAIEAWAQSLTNQ